MEYVDQKALEAIAGFDGSQILALINAVGGRENALDLCSGEKKAIIEEVLRLFIDKNARGIPFADMISKTVDADRDFYLTQPVVDYMAVRDGVVEAYGSDYNFMSVYDFRAQCEKVLERVRQDKQIANLLKGPYFPWVLPQLKGDLGKVLDEEMIPAMERSYLEQFPNRSFTNYRHGELEGEVIVISGTRQDLLVEAMAKESVCGIYFPVLQGFSILADREFITQMPEDVILAGMEIPAVVTAYPGICGRDWNTLGLDMASLQWQSSESSLYFKAGDGSARFVFRFLNADANYAGGVSFLG